MLNVSRPTCEPPVINRQSGSDLGSLVGRTEIGAAIDPVTDRVVWSSETGLSSRSNMCQKRRITSARYHLRSHCPTVEVVNAWNAPKNLRSFINLDLPGLEIGPSFRRFARSWRASRSMLSTTSARKGLRQKYTGHGVNLDAIEHVDFVWNGDKTYSQFTGKTYGWIIASHVIEHTPDLVSFLQVAKRFLVLTACWLSPSRTNAIASTISGHIRPSHRYLMRSSKSETDEHRNSHLALGRDRKS